MTDAIDKLIERLRNPKLNEDMCSIPLRYEAVEALKSQQIKIENQQTELRMQNQNTALDKINIDSMARGIRSQKAEIKRQDAVIARLGEDKMFAIGYSCATELLTRIEYARANRKPESNDE